MNLEEAGQFCFDQVPLLAKPLPANYWPGTEWQARVRFLFEEETKHKRIVNQAMREFSETRHWVTLDAGSPTFLACCRLLCASDTVNILLAGNPPVTLHERDGSRLLAWLLLHQWNEQRWDTYLKLQALSSYFGGSCLYGKPPAEF